MHRFVWVRSPRVNVVQICCWDSLSDSVFLISPCLSLTSFFPEELLHGRKDGRSSHWIGSAFPLLSLTTIMIGLAWDHVPSPEPITAAVGGIKDWLACVTNQGSMIDSIVHVPIPEPITVLWEGLRVGQPVLHTQEVWLAVLLRPEEMEKLGLYYFQVMWLGNDLNFPSFYFFQLWQGWPTIHLTGTIKDEMK